jgi:hypothetical protein
MKIHNVKQGTAEWLELRSMMPTASEFDQLVSPAKLKVREGKGIASYVAHKLAEKWFGHPIQAFTGSGEMDQGSVREAEARPWYALEKNCEVEQVGFISNEDEKGETCGCSPDGLVKGENRGLEIKCPAPNTQVAYLLAGELPQEYLTQVQGAMLVTGFEVWTFLSYYPRMPQLVIDVPRDEKVISALRMGLETYWEMFEEGWKKLIEANGGYDPTTERDYKGPAMSAEDKAAWEKYNNGQH